MELNPYEAPLEPADQTVFRDASRLETLILPVCRQFVRAVYAVAPIILVILAYVAFLLIGWAWDYHF